MKVEFPTGASKTGNAFTLNTSRFVMNSPSSSDADKARLVGFVRYDKPNWLFQADISQGGFSIASQQEDKNGTSYSGYSGKRYALVLQAAYKPAPWLRLQAGFGINKHTWETGYLEGQVAQAEQRLKANDGKNPSSLEIDKQVLTSYQNSLLLLQSYKTTQLTGHYGVGVDLGGLTIDVSRTEGLTPLLNGVVANGQTVEANQNYGYTSLSVGYRLFPLKKFALATNNNKTYQKLKREIPFYRNEFSAGLGIIGEDIGTGITYENRYTRYFSRRFGVTGIIGATRTAYQSQFNSDNTKAFTDFQFSALLRTLPLYTRRHQIGLSFGINVIAAQAGLFSNGSSFYPAGPGTQQPISVAYLSERPAKTYVGGQWQFDYQFAATDRVPVGIWLRNTASGFANLGIQAGYRF
ncbi:hypothetical protein [Fibrella aquatilis]|uniref:Uncharacterized protein n=1 Tax=Fibrella aquatilis TaxID=2817059 RepID=A0A939K1A1_9BACT|nr:hypothetical protein [Fibrella aquatilis]MBO0932831.1 hypothetical protein [Fibrella aquatilis]